MSNRSVFEFQVRLALPGKPSLELVDEYVKKLREVIQNNQDQIAVGDGFAILQNVDVVDARQQLVIAYEAGKSLWGDIQDALWDFHEKQGRLPAYFEELTDYGTFDDFNVERQLREVYAIDDDLAVDGFEVASAMVDSGLFGDWKSTDRGLWEDSDPMQAIVRLACVLHEKKVRQVIGFALAKLQEVFETKTTHKETAIELVEAALDAEF